MDTHEFFAELAKRCEEGKCEECSAREFCYTAPRSMTADLINRTIGQMNLTEDRRRCTDGPTHYKPFLG